MQTYMDATANEENGKGFCPLCGAIEGQHTVPRKVHSDAAVLHRVACMLVDDPTATVIMLLEQHPSYQTLERKGHFFSAFLQGYDPKAKGISEAAVHKALRKLDKKHPKWRARHGKYGG